MIKALGGASGALATAAAAVVTVASSHASTSGQSLGAPPPQLITATARVPGPGFSRPLVNGSGSSGPSAFKGRVVVVAFWSSWCAPCRTELRELQSAARKAPAASFLGVDVDDARTRAMATLDRAGVSFANVADPDAAVADAFRIAGTPTIVVVDAQGRIAATAVGPIRAGDVLRLVREVASGQSPPDM